MALITCPDCGKDISDKATACIHCGCPIETIPAKTTMPSEQHKNNEYPELLPGLVDYIGDKKDPFQFKIRAAEGHHVIADKDTTISDLNKKSSHIQKEAIQIGSIVYFKQDFSEEGRLKQIFFSTDISKSSISNSDFKKATNLIRTSAPTLETNQTSSANQGAKVSDDQKITKNYLWFLLVILIAGGYWVSKGTPAPSLFLASDLAKEECLNLANKNKNYILFNDNKIDPGKTWLKDGKRVVQLLQKEGSNMRQIMCVYGQGTVQIPSLIDQGKWQ